MMRSVELINDDELVWLDAFLASDDVPEGAMDVAMLEGFVTAMALAPRLVRPSQWLPWVWDPEHGQAEPIFANHAQVQRVMDAILGLSNRVLHAFQTDPSSFRPVFQRRPEWSATRWCQGFLLATELFDAWMWRELWVSETFRHGSGADAIPLLTPFLRLGEKEGAAITSREGDAKHWEDAIVPALVRIHAYWAEARSRLVGEFALSSWESVPTPVRRGTKVGRNEPCPCGSGKKFKKCCGSPRRFH